MKAYLSKTIMFLAMLAGTMHSSAQLYDHTYEVSTYQELTGATVIEVPEEGYFLDLDREKFLCFSEVYRADGQNGLKITREGSFSLNDEGTVAVFLFSGGFIPKQGTEYSYLIEGQKEDTNRVVKVQYSNVGFNYGEPDEFINFQIWVYPNTGDFEVHVGSYLVNTNGSSYSTGTSAWGPVTGVIRRDTAYNFINVVTLAGNSASAQAVWNFQLLGDTPAEGAIIKFYNQAEPIDHTIPDDDDDDGDDQGNGTNPNTWPIGINDVDDSELEVKTYPNPASRSVILELNASQIKGDPILMEVHSITGQLIERVQIGGQQGTSAVLNVSQWPSGTYFISGKDRPNLFSRLIVVH